MSASENKAMVRRYLDAINGQDKPVSLLSQYIADADQALFEHTASAESAFPHYELIAEDLIAKDDKVVVRKMKRTTHRGNFMGIPATGKAIAVPGQIIYQITQGKIINHWLLVDSATMMQQLGVH